MMGSGAHTSGLDQFRKDSSGEWLNDVARYCAAVLENVQRKGRFRFAERVMPTLMTLEVEHFESSFSLNMRTPGMQ